MRRGYAALGRRQVCAVFRGEMERMREQHTPGPWRRGKIGGCVVADHPVPEIGGSDAVDYYGGHLIAESIAPQNVPLIAAAPELLDALESAVGAMEALGHPPGYGALAKARAAIATAKEAAQ